MKRLADDTGGPSQKKLTGFFQAAEQFKPRDARQSTIRKAIVKTVIDCSLPLVIVEHPTFQELIRTCEPKYNPISRSVVFKMSELANLKILLECVMLCSNALGSRPYIENKNDKSLLISPSERK